MGSKPVKHFGGEKGVQRITAGATLAADWKLAVGNRPRLLLGPIDRHDCASGSSSREPPPRGQKQEAMAKPARPVYVANIAGVDPELDAVTIFRPGGAAPQRLLFPSTRTEKASPASLQAARTSARAARPSSSPSAARRNVSSKPVPRGVQSFSRYRHGTAK